MSFRAWLTVWFVLVVVVAGAFVVGEAFCRRLRSRHREVWERLGEPRLFHLPLDVQVKFGRFLSGREYERLDDPILNRLAEYGRWLATVSIVILIALIVGGIVHGRR